MTDGRGVDAVERALSILDAFGPHDGALTLAELARRTGLYKSTILRIAVSLERFGYLVRQESGLYRLGPAAWRIGAAYRQSFDIGTIVRPELKQLSEATGETASFYVREGDTRVCLYRSEPARAIRHTITEGAPMQIAFGATGKALLAFSGEPGEVYDRIRAEECASSFGERDPDVAALAVPVLTPQRRLVGALALSGLITRFSVEARPAMIDALRSARARVEAQLMD